MNEQQRRAYDWAKKQQFHSVAADNARELAGLVDKLMEENKTMRAAKDEQRKLYRELSRYRDLGTVEELEQALYEATL